MSHGIKETVESEVNYRLIDRRKIEQVVFLVEKTYQDL